MPNYAYICVCKHAYEEFRSIMSAQPTKCPACGEAYGKGFQQDFGKCEVTTWVYGNPKTVGQLAEMNTKRLKEQGGQEMAHDRNWTGPVPEGATVVKEKGETPPWRDGSMGIPAMDKPLNLDKVKDVTKYVMTGDT